MRYLSEIDFTYLKIRNWLKNMGKLILVDAVISRLAVIVLIMLKITENPNKSACDAATALELSTRGFDGGCMRGAGAGPARPISAPSHFSAPARIAGRCPKTKGSKSAKPISFFVGPANGLRWEDRYSVSRGRESISFPSAPHRPLPLGRPSPRPPPAARRPFARMFTIIILLNGRYKWRNKNIYKSRERALAGANSNYGGRRTSDMSPWRLHANGCIS